MPPKDRSLGHILFWLIAGSRGGVNRGKIISLLRGTPMNANQLASALDVDYRTIRHHLDILEKNEVVTPTGDRYGLVYFLSQNMEKNYAVFESIWNRIGKSEKSNTRDETTDG
jgi:DNA-binding transcriptional ArsR family regulator